LFTQYVQAGPVNISMYISINVCVYKYINIYPYECTNMYLGIFSIYVCIYLKGMKRPFNMIVVV